MRLSVGVMEWARGGTHLHKVAPKTRASLSSVITMSMMPNLLSRANSASASPGAYLLKVGLHRMGLLFTHNVDTESIRLGEFLEAFGKPMFFCPNMFSVLHQRPFIAIKDKDDIDSLVEKTIELVEQNSELRVFTCLGVSSVIKDSLGLV